ncbi:MAG: alpha/beta hydrolase-fold protein [Massilibacteroides sp.]|nr:alpha/beta hydrolase-fold protein [Massilibacteroides sp.]MDD3064051.1 alpha/beta hydrolase-fold protein [Massilibacteroides sp.]MDD4115552.1 alpha/beta hydrolase-fold protein [Massilibacteroides sp.]MDD4660648.1 alpha/beta hydrolase-fold protein [Massilibacteroides sp.]
MKRTIFLFAALFMSLISFAQQALWGGQDLISPEIHADNTVTFRFMAPNAEQVQVTGDFLPTRKMTTSFGEVDAPGIADLRKNEDGVWEYITPEPLSSELYSYSFLVDGLKVTDPNNVYLNRDVASVTNIFIIKGGQGDVYSVNKVPHGTVARYWYDSPSLGLTRRITVYTPAGYEKSTQTYPVLYLLHGMGGDEEAWVTLGRTVQILDNLIAQGKAEPMLVVMPNGNASQEAAPGESSLGLVQPNMQLPKTMDGEIETSFPDVIQFVESTFRVEKQKSARAIAGLSMGGFHSLHISKEYPDMFDYVGLFSAAISPREGMQSPIYQNMEEKLKVQFDKHPKLYWIGIGKTDFLYKNNVDFRKKLDDNGYKYEYRESDGGHIWKNWRIYLSEFAPRLFK